MPLEDNTTDSIETLRAARDAKFEADVKARQPERDAAEKVRQGKEDQDAAEFKQDLVSTETSNPFVSPPQSAPSDAPQPEAPQPEAPPVSPFQVTSQIRQAVMDPNSAPRTMLRQNQAAEDAETARVAELEFPAVDAYFRNQDKPEVEQREDGVYESQFAEELKKTGGKGEDYMGNEARANPEPIRNEQGLLRANQAERSVLADDYEEAERSHALYLLGKNPSLRDELDKDRGTLKRASMPDGEIGFDPQNFDPQVVFEKLGWAEEDRERFQANWYQMNGFEPPNFRDEDGSLVQQPARAGKAANPELAKRAEQGLADKSAKAREIYGFEPLGFISGGGDYDLDELTEYLVEEGGYERPTARRMAEQSGTREQADVLMNAEIARTSYWSANRVVRGPDGQAMTVAREYAEEYGDQADDLGRYTLGYSDSFVNGFRNAAYFTPKALAAIGVGFFGLVSQAQEGWHGEDLTKAEMEQRRADGTSLSESQRNADMYFRYAEGIGKYFHDQQTSTQMLHQGISQSGLSLGSRALTEWNIEASALAGMLAFDMGTSLLTGGTSVLSKVAVKLPAYAIGRSVAKDGIVRRGGRAIAKGVSREVTGAFKPIQITIRPGIVKTITAPATLGKQLGIGVRAERAAIAKEAAAAQAQAAAKLPRIGGTASGVPIKRAANPVSVGGSTVVGTPAREGLSQTLTVAGSAVSKSASKNLPTFGKIANRQVHAPNAFIARVVGETYATSIARQAERARENGVELTVVDSMLAFADATAHGAIASLIGKNIPFTKGKYPKKGPGSTGFYGMKGKKGFAPRSLSAARQMSVTRSLMGLNRGGADFVAFELLMDAYSLTDHEDRVQTLLAYSDPSEKFKSLFGSYMMGLAIKVPGMPGTAMKPFKEFKQFQKGQSKEALSRFLGLPKDVQRQIFDRLSDARKEGMKDLMEKQDQAVQENREVFDLLEREQLASILYYGDREMPEGELASHSGSVEAVPAAFSIHGSRIKGAARELLNENGNLEVTRYMAMQVLRGAGRHGMAERQGGNPKDQTAVQFMNGRVDLLFATREETRRRIEQSQDEHASNQRGALERIPEKTPTRQINPVKGFIENVRGVIDRMSSESNSIEVLNNFPMRIQQEIFEAIRNEAIANAKSSGNNREVIRLRNLQPVDTKGRTGGSRAGLYGKKGRTSTIEALRDPSLRPLLYKYLREYQIEHSERGWRQFDEIVDKDRAESKRDPQDKGVGPESRTEADARLETKGPIKAEETAYNSPERKSQREADQAFMDRLVDSNAPLIKEIIQHVRGGRNTKDRPAISRAQMSRLAGPEGLGKTENTKAQRYRLARQIERHVYSSMNRHEAGMERRPDRLNQRVKNTRYTPPVSEAKTFTEAKNSTIEKDATASKETIEQSVAEAERAGVEPLNRRGEASTETPTETSTETKAPKTELKPIDETMERLGRDPNDASRTGPAEPPLREPYEVKDAEGNSMSGGKATLRERAFEVLGRLKDENQGVESVQMDWSEQPRSAMGESLFALGRANGMSVVIVTGKDAAGNSLYRNQVRFMDGFVVVGAGMGIQSARRAIASHGATVSWAAERGAQKSPLMWLYNLANFGGAKNIGEVHRAFWYAANETGRTQGTLEAWRELSADMPPGGLQMFKSQILLAAAGGGKNRKVELPAEMAILFHEIFTRIDPVLQAEIIKAHPVEMAKWLAAQKEGLESVGHENPRKGSSVIGTGAHTKRVLEAAETGTGMRGVKGKILQPFVKAISDGVVKIKEATATHADIIGEARRRREVIEETVREERDVDAVLAKTETVDLLGRQEGARSEVNMVPVVEIEKQFPGVLNLAHQAVQRNPSAPQTFEHMGMTFTVTARRFGGKPMAGRLEFQPTTSLSGSRAAQEAAMPKESQAVADQARALALSSETRGEVTVAELAASAESSPSSSEKPPADGSVEYSHEGGSSKPSGMSGFRQLRMRAMRYVMDQFNLSAAVEFELLDKPLHEGVKAAYEVEQRVSNEQQERQDTFRRMLQSLEKDQTSRLVNGKDGSLLAEILNTPIEPTMEAMGKHPLTRKLSEKEMTVIKEIKDTFEEHRQEYMSLLKKSSALGYKLAPNDAARVAKANEFNEKLNVKLLRVSKEKNKFELNDGESRVTMDRSAFIDFMSKQHVPESWGNKWAYMPHLFFSNTGMRASVEVYKDGVLQDKHSQKFGIGKESKRELEHGELLDHIEGHVATMRSMDPSFTFKVKVKEGSRRISQDAMYLSKQQQRSLVKALKTETRGSTSDINAALAGKITTRAVDKAFLSALLHREGAKGFSTDVGRVFEVALQNHYRNKLSREMNEATAPYLKKLEAGVQNGTHPEWVVDHFRGILRHATYGTPTSYKMMESVGGARFARGIESTLSNLRAFQFYRQLMRVGQHFINSTQAAQVWGLVGSKDFMQFVNEYNSPKGAAFLKEHGFFDVNGKFDAGKFGDSLQGGKQLALLMGVHGAVNKVTGKVWNANSEARNQNFAFYALARHAEKNLNRSPEQAAEYGRLWGSLFTQYRYSKVNDPVFLRGSAAKTVGQFKRFQVQTLGMANTLLLNARNPDTTDGIPRGAFTRFMLLNTAMGGLRGSIMGAAAILAGGAGTALYQELRAALDDEYVKGMPDATPFASQEQAYEWLTSGYGTFAGEMVSMGFLRVAGIDASGTFNLTNIGYDGIVGYLGGPTYGMVKRTVDEAFVADDALGRSRSARAFASLVDSGLATKGMKTMYEMCLYWEEMGKENNRAVHSNMLGVFSANKHKAGTGEFVAYRTKLEAFYDAVGLKGADGSSQYQMHANAIMWSDSWNSARHKAAALYNKDPDAALKYMSLWNRDYGAILPMYISSISEKAEGLREKLTTPRIDRTRERISNEVMRARNAKGLSTSTQQRERN